VLRGGAVKPRTSPHDFQGVGRSAYQWFAEIAHEYGMLAASEALSEADVPEALEYLDIVQIGARNMQNFALLKLLSQSRKPVILKRGPGATLREWAFAAEYLLSGGNTQVILCERGVRGLEAELRYTLDFAGAAWMQQRYRLPVIIDPSHATGSTALLPVCTAATMAMGFAGVMLETHPNPVEAKSDALQALRLEEFQAIRARYS
jgi:3-deoxy-7-phosphoheptulonate synthase